jgi:hypothetical protein
MSIRRAFCLPVEPTVCGSDFMFPVKQSPSASTQALRINPAGLFIRRAFVPVQHFGDTIVSN